MFICRFNCSLVVVLILSISGVMGLLEKIFLNFKKMIVFKEIRDEKGLFLDDFDKEIEIY